MSDDKKKVFFIAVTDEEGSNNRKYSDFVYELCCTQIVKLNDFFDIDNFNRHDMQEALNIKESLHRCLSKSDVFIILLDMYQDGFNPNVWFELGVISTYDKPIILIAKEKTLIPFDVNDIKVIRISENVIDSVGLEQLEEVDEETIENVKSNKRIKKHIGSFSHELSKALELTLTSGNPFSVWYDQERINNLGYNSLTDLFVRSGIINLIKNPDVRAEYIRTEREAFKDLIYEVGHAKTSLRTSRFANQSIVSGERKNKDVHDEFMKVLCDASKKDTLVLCDRIVCNNEPSKWTDISEVLVKSSSKMRVFVRQDTFSIGFELVIVDEYIAFIHFYQIDNHGDTDDNGYTYENEIEVINSTLKIRGESVCRRLANIFDRLHHRDFDTNSKDPSRTLLGIPKKKDLSPEEQERGYFQLLGENIVENDVQMEQKRKDKVLEMFEKALKEWEFVNLKDKENMAIGMCLLDRHFTEKLSDYFEDEETITQIKIAVKQRRDKQK